MSGLNDSESSYTMINAGRRDQRPRLGHRTEVYGVQSIPAGYCQCGCGEQTRLAPRTDRGVGWIKGEPLRFIRNHHHRKPPQEGIETERGIEIPLVGERGTGRVALVDPDDYPKVAGIRWHMSTGGYVCYSPSSKRKVYLHRIIMPYGEEVDHANGDPLDCRRSNLRPATGVQNKQNRRRQQKKKSSRFTGVYGHKKVTQRWRAVIKNRYLGVFDREEDAAMAYDRAARAEYGEFARLNFPDRITPVKD